jgi:hypothetical protein
MQEKVLGQIKVKYWYIKVIRGAYILNENTYCSSLEFAKKFPSQKLAAEFAKLLPHPEYYVIDCVMENVAEEHEKKLGKNAFKL